MWFELHLVSSILSAALILVLGVQCMLKKMKYHKQISYAMIFFGFLSLIGSLMNGVSLNFSLTLISAHNWLGIISFMLSLGAFLLVCVPGKKCLMDHFMIGKLAGIFAALALITGVLAYSGLISYTIFGETAVPSVNNTVSPGNSLSNSTEGITLAEVASHASASSCWIVVSGKVYDITAYIPMHRGSSILDGCGKESTTMFNSERKHTGAATADLGDYYIGELGS